ncbi:hypothetical protein HC928_10030 [bacterium]|nr:hypothetical protein [bacterium]
MTVVDNQQLMVAGVRFTKVGKLYHFDYSNYPAIQAGDYVIVETMRGRQMGQVMGFTQADPSQRDYKPIMRPATPRDLVLRQQWQEREPEALAICQEKADASGQYADVKFVAAQYNYDGTVLTFLLARSRRSISVSCITNFANISTRRSRCGRSARVMSPKSWAVMALVANCAVAALS